MSSERRHLTSATELRALSHPTRLTLLTLLDEEGPLTATEAGERIEELLKPYVEREVSEGRERRPGTLPVAFGLFAVPTRLPADEDEGDVR